MLKDEYHHSASSANTFIDSPAYWIITKLYDFEGPVNSRMVMGSAAEYAANEALSDFKLEDVDVRKIAKEKYLELKGDPNDQDCERCQDIAMRG